MSAGAMAEFYKGMTDHETAVLTDAMMRLGDTIDLSRFGTKSVDKHSTGGVGDKTTLDSGADCPLSLGGKMAKCPGAGSVTRAARSISSNPSPATKRRSRQSSSCSRSKTSALRSSGSPAT